MAKKVKYHRIENMIHFYFEDETKSVKLPKKAETIVLNHANGSVHIAGRDSKGEVWQSKHENIWVSATLKEIEF